MLKSLKKKPNKITISRKSTHIYHAFKYLPLNAYFKCAEFLYTSYKQLTLQ